MRRRQSCTSRHRNQHAVARRDQARSAHGPPDRDQEHAGEALAAERIALPHQRLRGAADVCTLTGEQARYCVPHVPWPRTVAETDIPAPNSDSVQGTKGAFKQASFIS